MRGSKDTLQRLAPIVAAIGASQSPGERDDNACIICLDQPASVLFRPCSHRVTCPACARLVMQWKQGCPLCRSPAQSVMTDLCPTNIGVKHAFNKGDAAERQRCTYMFKTDLNWYLTSCFPCTAAMPMDFGIDAWIPSTLRRVSSRCLGPLQHIDDVKHLEHCFCYVDVVAKEVTAAQRNSSVCNFDVAFQMLSVCDCYAHMHALHHDRHSWQQRGLPLSSIYHICLRDTMAMRQP